MAGSFKLNPNWFRHQEQVWSERLVDLNDRILASSQEYVPVGRPRTKYAGPYETGDARETKQQLKKLSSKRQTRSASRQHKPGTLKRSGERFEGHDLLTGGVRYKAPYAIYVEVGTSRMTGRHYLLKGLLDHREEIEKGSFLKED